MRFKLSISVKTVTDTFTLNYCSANPIHWFETHNPDISGPVMIIEDQYKPVKCFFSSIIWKPLGLYTQVSSPFIPFTPPVESLCLSLSLTHPPLSLLDSRSRTFPYKAVALCSCSMTESMINWMGHKLSINSTAVDPTRLMPCYALVSESPLSLHCPSFFCLPSVPVMYPSFPPFFLASLCSLCVTTDHVTPSHLRTVVPSTIYNVIQTKSLMLSLVN